MQREDWRRPSWTKAEVHHAAPGLATQQRMRRIDSVRGKRESLDVQVRRGKAEASADLISPDHRRFQRITAAQHLAGLIELPAPDRLADACAADGLAVQRNCRQAVHRKMELPSQGLKQGDVTA